MGYILATKYIFIQILFGSIVGFAGDNRLFFGRRTVVVCGSCSRRAWVVRSSWEGRVCVVELTSNSASNSNLKVYEFGGLECHSLFVSNLMSIHLIKFGDIAYVFTVFDNFFGNICKILIILCKFCLQQ